MQNWWKYGNGIAVICVAIAVSVLLFSCTGTKDENKTWRQAMNPDHNTVNNINLYTETYGSGKTILLLHGFGASTYSWRELFPVLSGQYRLLAIDLKGFGKSPKPKENLYSVYDQAALVIDIIRKNDLRDFVLIGHSYGGAVSLVVTLNLTEQDPTRVSKLILIDSMAYSQKLPGFIKILRTPVFANIGLHLLPSKTQAKSILKLAYYDDNKIPDKSIAEYSLAIKSPGGKYALMQAADQIIPDDIENLCSSYGEIRIPTLILWGREDEIVPLWVGERLSKDIPNSKLVVFEHCGHIPHEEKPKESIPVIEQFLSDQ